MSERAARDSAQPLSLSPLSPPPPPPPPQLSSRALDGVLRWVLTKMSNKKFTDREALTQERTSPPPAPGARRGISVILDIFRRADKNDDGKLSLDEFRAFFSDGTLNEEELEKLFHTIDSDNTNNVDTKELCDYFAAHMGSYEDVLASLETLNLSILSAMDYTKKVYENGTKVEQFVTRFLLKETANQIQSLLTSVESAVDAIEDQASQTGYYQSRPSHWYSQQASGNLINSSPVQDLQPKPDSGSLGDPEDGLEMQINRLSELIGRLENNSVWFDLHQRISESDNMNCSHLFLVRQQMRVSHKELGQFCDQLREYLKIVSDLRHCFHVTAVRLPDGVSFAVYQFWESEEEWKSHLQSACCKAFQHIKVDTLTEPETISTLCVPAAWCTVGGK